MNPGGCFMRGFVYALGALTAVTLWGLTGLAYVNASYGPLLRKMTAPIEAAAENARLGEKLDRELKEYEEPR